MSTTQPISPSSDDPPPRGAVLEPLCDLLLDVVEELHGMEGTRWAADPHRPDEREATISAIRAVTGMMRTYGRTRDEFMFPTEGQS